MVQRLQLATRNENKVREFSRILSPYQVTALPEEVNLPAETGTTFADNALLKARAAAAATGLVSIADDSGISADCLAGAPGIYSARFAGEGATDTQNLAKFIQLVPAGERIYYTCVVAYVDPKSAREEVFTAHCEGRMAEHARGDNGFGYDPIFIPDHFNDQRTAAELTAAEKDAISHRGQAARLLLTWLKNERASGN